MENSKKCGIQKNKMKYGKNRKCIPKQIFGIRWHYYFVCKKTKIIFCNEKLKRSISKVRNK